MKIKGSLEQAVCILLVIAHTKGHAPVKSYTLSERLGLSDSYLKKIMRQLVVAGLVDSEAGKKGGFVLKRAPKTSVSWMCSRPLRVPLHFCPLQIW